MDPTIYKAEHEIGHIYGQKNHVDNQPVGKEDLGGKQQRWDYFLIQKRRTRGNLIIMDFNRTHILHHPVLWAKLYPFPKFTY